MIYPVDSVIQPSNNQGLNAKRSLQFLHLQAVSTYNIVCFSNLYVLQLDVFCLGKMLLYCDVWHVPDSKGNISDVWGRR